jgi:hypothetical protein
MDKHATLASNHLMRVSHHEAEESGAPEKVLSHHVRQEPEPIVILHSCHCVVCHNYKMWRHLAGPLAGQLDYLLQGLTEHLQEVVLIRIYL